MQRTITCYIEAQESLPSKYKTKKLKPIGVLGTFYPGWYIILNLDMPENGEEVEMHIKMKLNGHGYFIYSIEKEISGRYYIKVRREQWMTGVYVEVLSDPELLIIYYFDERKFKAILPFTGDHITELFCIYNEALYSGNEFYHNSHWRKYHRKYPHITLIEAQRQIEFYQKRYERQLEKMQYHFAQELFDFVRGAFFDVGPTMWYDIIYIGPYWYKMSLGHWNKKIELTTNDGLLFIPVETNVLSPPIVKNRFFNYRGPLELSQEICK